MTQNIWKIVLTGGPCSGKTTTLASIYERFSSKINVICVPETATMTFNAGVKIDPSCYSFEELIIFTKELVKIQIAIEEYFVNLAKLTKQDTLIIFDRGACDTFAYCSAEVKQKVLEELLLNNEILFDKRYDLVIHLVTSARGAQDFYNLENIARFESIDDAILIDDKIKHVWMEHPNFKVIDNSVKGFRKKIERVFNLIGNFINIPQQLYVKKLLAKQVFDVSMLPPHLHYTSFTEIFIYLYNEPNQLNYLLKRVS